MSSGKTHPPAPERRGLVEVFLTEAKPGEPTKVGLELYPPGRPTVSLEMFAAEAADFANGLLDAADKAEKENTNAGRTR